MQVADNSDSDSLKCDIIGFTAGYYWSYNLDTALILIDHSMDFCRKANYQNQIYRNHYRYAATYYYMGRIDSALVHIDKGLIALEGFDDIRFRAGLYNIESMCYQENGDYQKAIEISFKSLDMWIEEKDSLNMYSQYNNIANLYDHALNYTQAFKYSKLAIDGFRRAGEKISLGKALVSLSRYYGEEDPMNPERRKVLDEALLIGHEIESNDILGSAYLNKAYTFYHNKEFEKAKEFYEKSLYYNEQIGAHPRIFQANKLLARLNSQLGHYKEAEALFLSLLDNPAYENTGETREDFYFEMALHYERVKDFEKAYKYSMLHANIIDTIYNDQLASYSEEMDTKFKSKENSEKIAQQELEIQKQSIARQRVLFGGFALLLLSTGTYLFYYHRQNRKKEMAEQALLLEKGRADNLREVDKLKTQFFTNISHELRTPLTLITDPLSNILKGPIDESSKEDIELAHRNSEKLLGLVNEIMDLAKLEAGELKTTTSEIARIPFARRTFMSFESLASIREIQLEFKNEIQGNPIIEIDKNHLQKILNNLVSNAVKFSPIGEKIEMKIGNKSNALSIAIKDMGRGIKLEDHEKIFERFYQADHGDTSHGGTGVGLALSRELSKLIGGKIRVVSDLNNGSVFTLELPLNIIGKSHLESTSSITSHKTSQYASLTINGKKPKILIVEDNIDMSSYIQKLLNKDFDCTIANNGIEGLMSIQKQAFDLVVSDVMMPGMDGFELRNTVLKMETQGIIPYIFLTARSLDEDILKGLRLGADDYITKPFKSEELQARISNLIKNRINRMSSDISHTDSENIRFVKAAEEYAFKNMSDLNFGVTEMSKAMTVSQKQLSRILKSQTGMTTIEFILELRLQKARQLIERKTFNSLTDIRRDIGIESASYFSRKFKERYGVSPSSLLSQ